MCIHLLEEKKRFANKVFRSPLDHKGNYLVLHCASPLRMIFASLARAHERLPLMSNTPDP